MLGVCWVIAMSKVGGTRYQVPGTVFSSSKIKPKNRVLLYTEYIRRCSLVLSASSAASAFLLLLQLLVLLLLLLLASAAAASAAAAAAAADGDDDATALRTAGWSCSVFLYFLPTLLRKLHGDGCCTEPSEKFRVRPRYDLSLIHI